MLRSRVVSGGGDLEGSGLLCCGFVMGGWVIGGRCEGLWYGEALRLWRCGEYAESLWRLKVV